LLLDALTGELTSSELHATLGSRIDLIDGPSSLAGSVAKQVYDEAVARNAAIASEAGARAAAILVETNNRNLAIDTINATLSDISGTPDYAAGVTYVADDIVKYGGGLYKATETTTGNLPTNTSFWTKIGDYASLGDAVAGHSLILNDHETRITNTAGDVVAVASRTTAIETAVNSPTTGLSTKSSVAYVDTSKSDAISTAASATQLVQSHLDTTNTNVDTAQGTANTAVTNAATAQTTANTAVTAAEAVATRASTLEASVNSGTTGLGTKASVGYVDTAKSDAISAAATASQTLVSSIKVGGRNLMRNSGGWTSASSPWPSNGSVVSIDNTVLYGAYSTMKFVGLNGGQNGYIPRLKPSTEYTVSAMVKGSSFLAGGGDTHLHIQSWTDENTGNVHQEAQTASDQNITTEWRLVSQTFITPASATLTYCRMYFYPLANGYTLNVGYVKLEEGNKATDWTPAPEDVDAAIATSQAQADTAVANAATAQTTANTAVTNAAAVATRATALETAVNSGTTGLATKASVTQVATAKSEAIAASASVTDTISARLNTGDYSAVKVQSSANASSVTGLLAQYTVKLDVGGKVSGYGLASTGPTGAGSAFAVRADKFYVASPAGTPDYGAYVDSFPDLYSLWGSLPIADKIWNGYNHWVSAGQYEGRPVPASVENFVPFVVQTTPTVVDGIYILPGVYISDAYIKNGTITNAKIGNAAIDDAKIANLSAAKITAGAIGVGSYIQSTAFTAGSAGWKISADGTAELANAVVRGGVYATYGVIGGNTIDSTSIHSGTTGYGTGAGFYLGSNGTFSLGDKLTWNGSILSVGGDISAATGTFSGAVNVASGTSGARMEIKNNVIKVFDGTRLRIQIGDLSA
jgi:hypothetical protein